MRRGDDVAVDIADDATAPLADTNHAAAQILEDR
jgi:hypothetical protein